MRSVAYCSLLAGLPAFENRNAPRGYLRHAAIETTTIYADASHDEQRSIAERM